MIIKYTEGMKVAPGMMVLDMPDTVYHSMSEWVSNSWLKDYRISPAHANSKVWEKTQAMKIGTAFHMAVLEPERFNNHYTIVDVKVKTASEWKSAVKSLGSDDALLLKSEQEHIFSQVNALRENKTAMQALMKSGLSEASLFAQDDDGIKYKCRFDWIYLCEGGYSVIDLKKTQSIGVDELSRAVYNYGYYRQEAFYRMVYRLAYGRELDKFGFLFSEEKPPHANRYVEIMSLAVSQGEKEIMEDLHMLKTDTHPVKGLAHNDEIIDLPHWAQEMPEIEIE